MSALAAAALCCLTAARPARAQDTASAAAPCRETVQGVDVSMWREVAAEGFTFCLPPEWRVSGRTARHGRAVVKWGTGEPQRHEVRTEVRAVPASQIGALEGPPADSDIRRATEVIGGHDADLWRNRFGHEFYTGVTFASPRVWLTGDAASDADADLETAIYRTVRFPAP